MSETAELIVCAAIKLENERKRVVIPMIRYWDYDGRKLADLLDEDLRYNVKVGKGFITNFGRFVDRKEALKIAKENNQIRYSIGYEPDELYSEMLY